MGRKYFASSSLIDAKQGYHHKSRAEKSFIPTLAYADAPVIFLYKENIAVPSCQYEI